MAMAASALPSAQALIDAKQHVAAAERDLATEKDALAAAQVAYGVAEARFGPLLRAVESDRPLWENLLRSAQGSPHVRTTAVRRQAELQRKPHFVPLMIALGIDVSQPPQRRFSATGPTETFFTRAIDGAQRRMRRERLDGDPQPTAVPGEYVIPASVEPVEPIRDTDGPFVYDFTLGEAAVVILAALNRELLHTERREVATREQSVLAAEARLETARDAVRQWEDAIRTCTFGVNSDRTCIPAPPPRTNDSASTAWIVGSVVGAAGVLTLVWIYRNKRNQ